MGAYSRARIGVDLGIVNVALYQGHSLLGPQMISNDFRLFRSENTVHKHSSPTISRRRESLMISAVALCLIAVITGCGSGSAQTSDARAGATISIHPAVIGQAIHATVLGANSTVSFDTAIPGQSEAFRRAGMKAGRWPGGSDSDEFNWQTTTGCRAKSYVWPSATFDHYMTLIARPAGLDVAVTVNYGSSGQPACIAPGDPQIAAAWVHYANTTRHYGVRWWEVGNEVYGSWETDQHALPHDAATYASSFGNYLKLMKAQDPTIRVGIPVSPGAVDPSGRNWDAYVLAHTQFDYVDLHFYAQQPGKEDDGFLVRDAPGAFAGILAKLKAELATAGKPDSPIDIGEIGSVYDKPGKQTVSITQALFAGQALSEMLLAGVRRSTWWLGNGGCGTNGNLSASLYGWQEFGGYAIFSDGLPTPPYGGCSNVIETIPFGTLLPTARVYQVLSQSGFVTDGERMIGVTVPPNLRSVRAYAATHGKNFALLLFNLDDQKTVSVPITIDSVSHGSGIHSLTYGKTQYDLSRDGTWAGPAAEHTGPWTSPITVTLPPYAVAAYLISR